MASSRDYLRLAQAQAVRVPALAWLIAGVIAVAFAVVLAMQLSGPPYAALYDGLSPADGGKVIAQLQKLGIPYELQAAGNIILVPAPQLAAARLQLGAADVPGSEVATGWQKLEDAPMTASDLAQTTMAAQALQASLEQSIESMAGITSAQVYLALPPQTAFLGDQPKPTASVVIAADPVSAQAQGPAIAALVAGAVPGLAAAQVAVATTSGVVVYPSGAAGAVPAQFATVSEVEDSAVARVAQLLTPLFGTGNFRTNVSADIDFTQEHIQQITYGPTQIIAHDTNTTSDQQGTLGGPIGIPGAMSNEPPQATTAAVPAAPPPQAERQGNTAIPTPPAAAPAPPAGPQETHKSLDQTYDVGQSSSDITKPGWVVNGIAVSVVLNKAALGATTTAQVQQAIMAAFAYPQVKVNVLAANFQTQTGQVAGAGLLQAAAPLSRALLELLAAAALLFGAALPAARWLRRYADLVITPQEVPRPAAVTPLPAREFADLRLQASENPTGVARLLQSWVEENG
jgi:flagellar M-ring protein FliF